MEAMYILASAFRDGDGGLEANCSRAVELFSLSAYLGNTDSVRSLGALLHQGADGVEKDLARAAQVNRRRLIQATSCQQ